MADVHIHVEGLGPAGAAFALRALERGHHVTATEPKWPDLTWPATYGVLEADVPAWADKWFHPPHEVTAHTPTQRVLPYRYRMMNKPALLGDVRLAAEQGQLTVTAATSHSSHADIVIRSHGATRIDIALFQLAVGYVFAPSARTFSSFDAHPHPDIDFRWHQPEPRFMDWRKTSNASEFPPSFLYIQPVEDGLLIEETILVTHLQPHEQLDELKRRLHQRLECPEFRDFTRSAKITREEEVIIPMATRARAWYRPTTDVDGKRQFYFGASGGLIHPATGYSVGASLNAVDETLDFIAGKQTTLARPSAMFQRELAYWLRQIGGELIARADHSTLVDFFDCFFRLPAHQQLAYLTGHSGVEVMKTMWALRRETGFNHPFLQPLWKNPRSVYRSVKQRIQHGGD